MSVGKFDRTLPLPRQGRITVKGPFDPQDRNVENAKLLFLIVQGEGKDALIVEGEGAWSKDSGSREWVGSVNRRGKHADGGDGTLQTGLARGIALSIVIKPGKLLDRGRAFDPPMIEALTWCADFTFVDPASAT
jgi:hypothetical protein